MIPTDSKYWSTGIVLTWQPERPGHAEAWGAHLDYLDEGFLDDEPAAGRISTEGTLRTRYPVEDVDGVNVLAVVLDVLIADAERLGIVWRNSVDGWPMLYYRGDGEDPEWPPPSGYREMLTVQAKRLHWATYGYTPTMRHWLIWTPDRRELISSVSGPDIKSADDALRQATCGEFDFEHTKADSWVEECDAARLEATWEWDALSESQKRALRPGEAVRSAHGEGI